MGTTKKITYSDTHNSFQKAITRFRPYWPLFSLLIIIALALSFLYSRMATKLYQASASVLIQDNKKGTENSKQMEALDVLQAKKIIDNETDVVISKPLLLEVVNDMQLYASVYEDGFLRDKLLYFQSPVSVEARNPALLEQYDKVPFHYDALSKSVLLDDIVYPCGKWHATQYGELKFVANPQYLQRTGRKTFLLSLASPGYVAHHLRNRLSAKPTTKLSSIIDISFQDEDPRRAEEFVNRLVNSYISHGIREKQLLADSTLNFISERLAVVKKELHAIEQNKQQYAARNDAFDLSTKGKLFLESVTENDRKTGEINTSLAVLNELEQYVSSSHPNSNTVPSTVGLTDPMLAQMVQSLYNSQLEFDALSKTAGENNPIVMPLKSRIEKIKPDIRQQIANQRRNLEASRNNISSINSSYAALLSALPKAERDMLDLDREQNVKAGVYSFLLQKQEETALSKQAILPESRVISSDVTYAPVKPKMNMVYLGAIALAIIGGMGFVTVKETFAENVMFRDQIEHATNLPVIGEISIGASRDPIVIADNSKTFIAEQFRRLRMSLSYPSGDAEPKRILVTSAISGEGKSFIASNLALALAISGKKVALLDFDLNNPSLNNKLNLSRNKGITDYLMGECKVDDIIYPTDLDPGLFLLSTGRLPKNPTELLMNERTSQLLNELDERFDYLVIDTAPVIPVTDAYILSKFCDITLYVIRHKYTPKIFLERIDDENKMHRLNNVGIIFNSVSSRGIGNNNYGYGYGYGYTYEDNSAGRRKRNALT